jgi:integrase
VRVTNFPPGVSPPKRVRIYARGGHHLLHFWDPAVRRTLYERVDGDLIDAIAGARRIDQRLCDFRCSGRAPRRLEHEELVREFCRDLERRADAGAVAVATAGRYRSALQHYLDFARQPSLGSAYPTALRVDRQFALDFSAFLAMRMISPNGHRNAAARRMAGQDFVLDAARAMFEWAADAGRGKLLPDGFRNPFRRRVLERRRVAADMAGEPDVTITMATAFLGTCDDWQLRLFAPVVFYGLRPGELVHLFHERLSPSFLDVGCLEQLAYMTKGRRNKRLPMLEPLYRLLAPNGPRAGLIFTRRDACRGAGRVGGDGVSLADAAAEFTRRLPARGNPAGAAAAAVAARDAVIRDAGGLTYKVIQNEFAGVARRLGWPAAATLKDFRHACNTALANGGVPEHERRYLLGQHPGRDAIVTYTHLNKVAEHYRAAVEQEMAPMLDVLRRRAAD